MRRHLPNGYRFYHGEAVPSSAVARTITISEDAYDRLASLTEDDESFSEVIVRLSRDYPDVTRFSGAFPEIGEVEEEELEREEFEI